MLDYDLIAVRGLQGVDSLAAERLNHMEVVIDVVRVILAIEVHVDRICRCWYVDCATVIECPVGDTLVLVLGAMTHD